MTVTTPLQGQFVVHTLGLAIGTTKFEVSSLSPSTHPSTDPTHHPKRHPDPISRFATVHPSDRQTDRPTNRWAILGNRSVPRPAYALYIDYNDAANNGYIPRGIFQWVSDICEMIQYL